MNKYRNKVIVVDGIRFQSQREAGRYGELKLLQKVGLISDLRLQVPYILVSKSKHGGAIKYLADFVYFDKEKGMEIIEDVKGYKTDVYKLKKRLMAELGYTITEIEEGI